MTSTATVLPRRPMLLIAAVQGVCLYLIYGFTVLMDGPGERLVVALPLWTAAIGAPLLLLLAIEEGNLRRVGVRVAGFVGLLVLLALYVGWQAEPHGRVPSEGLIVVFVLSIGLAAFKALMYLQQSAAGRPLSYQALFTHSWRNFLTGALAVVFVGVFWMLLALWGELFRVIGIDVFRDIFRQPWFVLPSLSLAFGVGVIVFRQLTAVIDSITRLLRGLITLLLPLIVGIAVAFLLSLPFAGLNALWETGYGTALLLWLLALILFFTNAVYQDGRGEPPYPGAVHRAIYVGLLATPVLAALSLYGLWLRVDQYGWTVERCWAFVVWLLLALFSVGYVAGILRRRDAWTADLARVNTAMGLVVLALMLLANSPLMDFRKISLSSQLARVEAGEIERRELDFYYLRNSLARPGYLAMERLREEYADSDPELLALLENPLPSHLARMQEDIGDIWQGMRYRPDAFPLPEGLREAIDRERLPQPGTTEPYLIRTDLDDDGKYEYALISLIENHIADSRVYYRAGSGWRSVPARPPAMGSGVLIAGEAVRSGDIGRDERRFDDLRLGELVLEVGSVPPEAVQSPDGRSDEAPDVP